MLACSCAQASLSELKDVLFVGNPIYEGLDRREAKLQVLKRIPQVCAHVGDCAWSVRVFANETPLLFVRPSRVV